MSSTSTASNAYAESPDADAAEDAASNAAALDMLLSDAALGMWRRWLPGMAGVRAAGRLASQSARLAPRGISLATELAKILAGSSTVEAGRDKRFADPGWTSSAVRKRFMQAYLAVSQSARETFDELDLDWKDNEKLGFILDNLIDATAPSNNPLLNPAAWNAARETHGTSVLAGARNFISDMSSKPRVPTMVDPNAFEVGRNLAMTPGAVVFRTPVFELIQYQPSTPRVRRTPLLIVPPTINKYYILDLAPGRSLIEYLVASGQQVFAMSWRNPTAEHSDWGFDTYGQAILDAMDTATRITRSKTTHLIAFCSGGILTSTLVGQLAAADKTAQIASLSLGVTVLAPAGVGLMEAAIDERIATTAKAASKSKGYLDGKTLAEIFAWLRPNDLIWNYWVSNYLQGQTPPAFDVLYWNADTTRMSAGLHADFLDGAIEGSLATPGKGRLFGEPVDLSALEADSYIVAGIADHISPWQSCYRSTQLLGGSNKFVLSRSGHIASLVNPPTGKKAFFLTASDNPPEAADWLEGATTEQGSWWPDYAEWLRERDVGEKVAPKSLGTKAFPPLEPAPGTYVFED